MKYLVYILLVLLLCACSSKEEPSPASVVAPLPAEKPQDVTWAFEADAINLYIQTSADLNMIDEKAHAITICVYQSAKREALSAKAKTKYGILELLKCEANPPSSIVADKFYLQPSTKMEFKLDRAEGANTLAVVAGFNSLVPESSFMLVPMPLHIDEERNWYLVGKDKSYSAAKMQAQIFINKNKVTLKGNELVK